MGAYQAPFLFIYFIEKLWVNFGYKILLIKIVKVKLLSILVIY